MAVLKGGSYVGGSLSIAADLYIGGNVTISGVNYSAISSINSQTGTTYTFILSDAGALVILTNSGAITLTVPLNSSVAFPVGTLINFVQGGAGKVTVSPAGGVTVNSKNSFKGLAATWASATLIKTATDTWFLMGDLIP